MKGNTVRKSLSFVEALAIVVGMIIGSGIFLKPGIVLNNAGSPLLSLAAWVVGGVITLASALSVAEIAAAIPKSGGLYIYLEELYGETIGFLLGWVQAIISYPASVAAQAIAFATYASVFVPLDSTKQKLLALGVLSFILIMNVLSTRYGGIIQTVATVGKLIPIVAIIALGLLSKTSGDFSGMATSGSSLGFGAAILGTLWAYDGWIGVTNMAGELKNPAKNLPKVIAIGVIFVIAVYATFNIAIFKVLPVDVIAASDTPGADAAVALLGKGGATFITAGIMVSVFGALNGYLMTAARVPMVMGEKNRFPYGKVIGRLHSKFETPTNALILQSILAVIYILSGSFNTLTDLLIFVLWIFFTMGVFGVFLLRRKQGTKEGLYKVPLYPITPLIGIIGGGYIVVSTIISNPLNSVIGILITLTGLPVLYFLKKKDSTITDKHSADL